MPVICPACRAIVPETSLVCEYCGTAVNGAASNPKSASSANESGSGELAATVEDANEQITKLKRIIQPSYKLLGIEDRGVDKAEQTCRHLSVFAGENKKVAAIVEEMRALIEQANGRIHEWNNARRTRFMILTAVYFAGVAVVLATLILLGHVMDPNDAETWIAGGLGLIGLIVGAIGGAIFGAIAGAIIGALLGMLLQWFLVSFIGNILLGVVWLAGFIALYFGVMKSKFE